MEEVSHHYLILIRKKQNKAFASSIYYHASNNIEAIELGRILIDMLEKLTKKEMEFLVIMDPVRIERLQIST